MFGDSLFKKIEKKTNINKETILNLAQKLQSSNMKDKNVLKDFVDEVSKVAGKEVSDEKKEKIVNAIINDKVPKNIDKFF